VRVLGSVTRTAHHPDLRGAAGGRREGTWELSAGCMVRGVHGGGEKGGLGEMRREGHSGCGTSGSIRHPPMGHPWPARQVGRQLTDELQERQKGTHPARTALISDWTCRGLAGERGRSRAHQVSDEG
jgi:hypothetical protein